MGAVSFRRNSNSPHRWGNAKEILLPSDFKAASKSKLEIELCIRTLRRNALFNIYERQARSDMGAFREG